MLIEGMILCAYACEINTAYNYLRGEFRHASRIFDKAIDEAREGLSREKYSGFRF